MIIIMGTCTLKVFNALLALCISGSGILDDC
jgi:hypothetical protein